MEQSACSECVRLMVHNGLVLTEDEIAKLITFSALGSSHHQVYDKRLCLNRLDRFLCSDGMGKKKSVERERT